MRNEKLEMRNKLGNREWGVGSRESCLKDQRGKLTQRLRTGFFHLLLVTCYLLLVTSCPDLFIDKPNIQDGIPDGYGTVSVCLTLGADKTPLASIAARTAMPSVSLSHFAKIEFVFTNTESSKQETKTLEDAEQENDNLTFELETGEYNLTVNAYFSEDDDNPSATGSSTSFTVSGTAASPITVKLLPTNTIGTGEGTLIASITYPTGAEVNSFTLTWFFDNNTFYDFFNDGTDSAPVPNENDDDTSTYTWNIPSLSASYYILDAQLSWGAKGYTGRTEVVHIYPDKTTTIDTEKWTVSEAEFISPHLTISGTGDNGAFYINYTNGTALTPIMVTSSPAYTEREATFNVVVSGFVDEDHANNIGLDIENVPGLNFSGYGSAEGEFDDRSKTFIIYVTYDGMEEFADGTADLVISLDCTITEGYTPASPATVTVEIIDGQGTYDPIADTRRPIPVTQTNVQAFNTYAGTTAGLNKHYILVQNIDLSLSPFSEANWTRIGDNSTNDDTSRFTGSFDGDGYVIEKLKIDTISSYQGMFGYISGGRVENLRLVDVNIVSSNDNIGGIAGTFLSNSTISNCSVSGTITGSGSVGGIAGTNNGGSTIINCYNTSAVTGTGNNIGGITGSSGNATTISSCFNAGLVKSSSLYVGGIAGSNSGFVSDSYNTGDVSGSNNYVGGIVGSNSGSVSKCYNIGEVKGYSVVGGIVGVCNYTTNLTVENNVSLGLSITSTSNAANVGRVYGGVSGSSLNDVNLAREDMVLVTTAIPTTGGNGTDISLGLPDTTYGSVFGASGANWDIGGADSAWVYPSQYTNDSTRLSTTILLPTLRGVPVPVGMNAPSVPEYPSQFDVADASDWAYAVAVISAGGESEYEINLTSDISIPGSTTNTFGSATDIEVTISGDHVITHTTGSLLRIAAGQTVTIENTKLKGRSPNPNSSLVYIDGGTFIMNGTSSVFDNTSRLSLSGTGGGVSVEKSGSFVMNGDSSVCNNTAGGVDGGSGGGVYVNNGTFTMNGNSSVSDNIANYGGGVYVINNGTFTMYGNSSVSGNKANNYTDQQSTQQYGYGGGVFLRNNGNFIMSGGTVYGNSNPSDPSLCNNSDNGAALYVNSNCTAQYGNGSDIGGSTTPRSVNNTITVIP